MLALQLTYDATCTIGDERGQKYVELETQLLKVIEDLALDETGIIVPNELVSSFERIDPCMLKKRILILDEKGLLKKTELGYSLTEKGKERLRK